MANPKEDYKRVCTLTTSAQPNGRKYTLSESQLLLGFSDAKVLLKSFGQMPFYLVHSLAAESKSVQNRKYKPC